MITKEKKYITPEEYLKLERESETKNEYYSGEIFAMSGATLNHNKISGNIFAGLHNKLKNTKCLPFGSNMRMYVSEKVTLLGLSFPSASVGNPFLSYFSMIGFPIKTFGNDNKGFSEVTLYLKN